MKAQSPIGIFDSGVGGTSIWREIRNELPFEDTLYLADSANAPYGNNTKERILELCHKNTEYLIDLGCKIIVVACNTATTNAITTLRNTYDLPFIGIEPAIKPAALKSKTKSVGVLATRGTLSSALFHETSSAYADGIDIIEVVGEGLVSLIEDGKIDSPEMDRLLQKYITPMLDAKVDHIVLGCSHYPYLIPKLEKLVDPNVKIIDSGAAVAKQTRAVLERHGLLNRNNSTGNSTFYTNGDITVLQSLVGNEYECIATEF